MKEIGNWPIFDLTVCNSTVFSLLNDSEFGPLKLMRKVERSLNCPDLVEQFKMFRKLRGIIRVLFFIQLHKIISGSLDALFKIFLSPFLVSVTETGQHKKRFHKILVQFYSVNPSLSPHFVKTGHLIFPIYFIIFGWKFCRLAEYSPSRDNQSDFSKQTVFNL